LVLADADGAPGCGDEPGSGAVREPGHVGPDPAPVQREAQVEQGGTAGEAQLHILGIRDGESPGRIGVQFDDVRGDAEAPRLRVVHRRRQAGGLEHRGGVVRRETECCGYLRRHRRPPWE